MANYRYSSDLINDILFRAGEPVDGTSDFEEEALRLLNRAYRAVWMGGGEFVKDMNEPWLWLKKDPPGTLTLIPVDESGTVNVANNSTSITFSATKSLDLDGYFFKVQGHPDVFRISAHTAGSAAATLGSVYTGATDTAAAYRLMKLEYILASDVLRLIAPMRVQYDNKSKVVGMDISALDTQYPLADVSAGVPDAFGLVAEQKIRFSHAGGVDSGEYINVEYDYLRIPDDLTDSGSEEPAVPLQHRHVLADIALFYLYTSKNDDRAELLGTQARGVLKAMQADNRARLQHVGGSNFGAIRPRMNAGRQHQPPLRTSSGFIIG